MRETPKSLRAYFILVGFFTVVGYCFTLYQMSSLVGLDATGGAMLLVSLFQLGIGAAYLYVGAKLPTLLRDNPQLPLRFATVAIILSILGVNIISVLVNVYIYYQLKRMAKETAPVLESQVLE